MMEPKILCSDIADIKGCTLARIKHIMSYKGIEGLIGKNKRGLLNRNRCKMSYTKNKGSIAYEMSKVQSG